MEYARMRIIPIRINNLASIARGLYKFYICIYLDSVLLSACECDNGHPGIS